MSPMHDHAQRYLDMFPHVDTLARYAAQASTVVELGVRTGCSTWALLEGLPADGRLVSVDINAACFHDCPQAVRQDPRWTFIGGDDRDPAIHQRLPRLADLVFIDTSHEEDHTLAELLLARWLGAPRIVLHDYMLDPVRRAIEAFCADGEYRLATVEESRWGLAVVER